MHPTCHVARLAASAALLVLGASLAAWAQSKGETFTASASAKTAAGTQVTSPVTIVITRLTTDKERDAVVAALKAGGTSGLVKSLTAMADAGYIEVGGRRTPVKYAFTHPTSGGRIVTVVAPTPIAHLGAGLPDAPAKKGFDVSLAILEVKDAGAGSGELVPAATVRVNETGAIQTQDYGAEAVRLTNVQAKK